METVTEQLLKTLQNLSNDQFEAFKWILKSYKQIPESKLDGANMRMTVDLLVQYFPNHSVGKTIVALRKINRNDLADELGQNNPGGENISELLLLKSMLFLVGHGSQISSYCCWPSKPPFPCDSLFVAYSLPAQPFVSLSFCLFCPGAAPYTMTLSPNQT